MEMMHLSQHPGYMAAFMNPGGAAPMQDAAIAGGVPPVPHDPPPVAQGHVPLPEGHARAPRLRFATSPSQTLAEDPPRRVQMSIVSFEDGEPVLSETNRPRGLSTLAAVVAASERPVLRRSARLRGLAPNSQG